MVKDIQAERVADEKMKDLKKEIERVRGETRRTRRALTNLMDNIAYDLELFQDELNECE